MIDKQTIDDVDILYICSYGQTKLPICVDLEHSHCKLKSQKSKKCNLRPVVSYEDYKRKEQECEELKKTLTEIKEIAEVEIECKTYEIKNDCFNEIRWKALNEHIDFTKQILQKISEVNNDR